MRVIAGTARGKRLAPLAGNHTRPTADRVREALFSILFSAIGSMDGMKILDLFAGSGALAIESLSRGARHVWLVENTRPALMTIEKNLISCRFSDHATIIRQDAFRALPLLAEFGPFDVIFVDPPYHKGLALKALESIAELSLLTDQGLVAVEVAAAEELPDSCHHLHRTTKRLYGSTALHFYSPSGQD